MSKINRPFQPIGDASSLTDFRDDVWRGLTKPGQKELYSKYLYDEVGSALFEAITLLPEYGLTRADARLLRQHAGDVAEMLERAGIVVELGSGTGSKTKWILSALAARQPISYYPIDISESALHRCWCDLGQIEHLDIIPIAKSYLIGLRQAVSRRPPGTTLLLLFLGSTIGNFEPYRAEEFLREIRLLLRPGDVFYLSADLQKEVTRMIKAYNDEAKVTAAFNLNLLARINRELHANFVLSQFEHEARYDTRENRIEMHLRSVMDHSVAIGPDLVVSFRRGETIWTESSYKFCCEDIVSIAERTGFRCEVQWVDQEWPFAQSLLRAVT